MRVLRETWKRIGIIAADSSLQVEEKWVYVGIEQRSVCCHKFCVRLYLWHRRRGAGYPGRVFVVMVLVLSGLLMPVFMREVPSRRNNLDFGILGGRMEYREEGNRTRSRRWVIRGGGMVIIFFLLALNLQGVAGGAGLRLDRGGVVFGCSFRVVVGVILEGAIRRLFT